MKTGASHLDLGPSHVGRAVENLALEVRGVDDVEIDEAERTDARRRQVLGDRAPEIPSLSEMPCLLP